MARLVFVPERDVSIFQDALCVGPLRRLQSTGFLIYIYIYIYLFVMGMFFLAQNGLMSFMRVDMLDTL